MTKPDERAPFCQLSVVYHMLWMPKTLWLDLWGHFKVPKGLGSDCISRAHSAIVGKLFFCLGTQPSHLLRT